MSSPPLSFAVLRQRYPHLYTQIAHMSEREKSVQDCLLEGKGGKGGGEPCLPLDAETGLCSTIMCIDFTAPLSKQEGCPMAVDSDANKCSMFMWRALQATESGSMGGDACRQYDLLSAYMNDISNTSSKALKFESLLGLTVAMANHQLHALLYRGDPDRNRSLFKRVADAWKRIFDSNAEEYVSKDLHSFAVYYCNYFQSLLKQAKKEYDLQCSYSFNYMTKKKAAPVAKVAAASAGAASAGAASAGLSNENAQLKPWEEDGWLPMTKSGKQKSPNQIRNELQKYIDQCKADGSSTQTKIIERMGVNSNTFRRFMNPKTYKNQWSATSNGTYLAAAQLLAEVKHDADVAKKTGKRKSAAASVNGSKKAKTGGEAGSFPSKSDKSDAQALIDKIIAQDLPEDAPIYDSCPQVVAKIKAFLAQDGMTKAAFLRALGNLNSNSLARFVAGKKQDQCANITYKRAYTFFEKQRLVEGKAKSAARMRNECEQIGGFSTRKQSGSWVFARF